MSLPSRGLRSWRERAAALVTLLMVSAVWAFAAPRAIAVPVSGEPAARATPAKGSGSSAQADFNGDGYADLAIGVRFEAVGTLEWAGAVNVLYGSSGGLQARVPDDQYWTQDSPSVKDVAEAGDFFGASLAAGDFNGDGYDDLAIGAFWEKQGDLSNAGAVNVLYGSTGGLQAKVPDDQFWTQDSPGVKEVTEQFDQFAYVLAAADFNSDGFADLAIGIRSESIQGVNGSGAVAVLYGTSRGLQASAPDDQFWTQDSPGVEDQAENWDLFGTALAAADFNGDGFPDLAIGSFHEDVGTVSNAGSVNVLYGSSSGLQADAPADQFWTQDSPGVKDSAEKDDWLGWVLAGGDFNGDGFGDLAMGLFFEDVSGLKDAGAAQILYGSGAGLQADAPDDQVWTQGSAGVMDQAEAGDWFGHAVAAGDFNGDGYDDLAIGASYEDVDGAIDAGAVDVLYGSVAGLQATSPDDQFWRQGVSGVQDLAEAGDWFGYPLVADDFNGDGLADLAITVRTEDINSVVDAGAVAALYGSTAGVQADNPDDQLWSQNSPSVKDVAEFGDKLGFGLE